MPDLRLVPGPPMIAATFFDLGLVGYVQEEWFISGTARSWQPFGELGEHGHWNVLEGPTAEYTTRIVVHRPADAARHNGVVVVEWCNVSGGIDAAPDWMFAHTGLVRDGVAWVGVSAQAVGVEGGTTIIGATAGGGLKNISAERYASLHHPGDSWSYDMFGQVGDALRAASGVGGGVLGGLEVKTLLAVGESQSAFRLTTYVNAIDPVSPVYDGVLVHSRGGSAAALCEDPLPLAPPPGVVHIRDDVRVPVLMVETETDLLTLGYLPARQDDASHIRLWEIAGTAHADTYLLGAGPFDTGSMDAAALAMATQPTDSPVGMKCDTPINSGVQHHYVLLAAFAHLARWAAGGEPPPTAPRMELAGSAFALDEHGNVRGGIRTPWVDVPTATLSGVGQTGAAFALLFGTTVPLPAATLDALYPTPEAYLDAFEAALARTVTAGFILEADVAEITGLAGAAFELSRRG